MSDNDEKLQQFIAVAGVDEERAKFYMESSAWDLELALTSFYDADTDQSEDVIPIETPRETEVQTSSINPSPISKPKPKKDSNSRFATLNTLNNSSDDEEEGQAFYAGGSENSGQQVLGPSKKKDIVAEMFKSVQEHGVEILDSGSSRGARAFKGTGYKLGHTSDDSEAVPGATEPPRPVQVTMKLWRDGFSVNDGPLRTYTDPSNREFLDSVRRGEIPQELRHGTNEVHLSMEDHRIEEFKQEVQGRYTKPFSGQGHTLGSPTPATVGAPLEEDKNVNEAHARQLIGTDPSLPTTNLQIRLADGSRLLGQFNHGHTLAQVRSFIIAARPQYETRPFSLLSTYPSRELQDTQTILDAGILNSAIMQKLADVKKGARTYQSYDPTRKFPGAGHQLASTSKPTCAVPPRNAQISASAHQELIDLDPSSPVTNLRIRLADGSVLSANFNHCHLVADVRNFIVAVRPEYASISFVLMATFPVRELQENETLESAGVLNTMIVQELL